MPSAAHRSFSAARDHHVSVAMHDEARRIADRVRAGGASGDDRMVGALEAVADGDLARRQIDQRARDKERADLARPVALQDQRVFRDGVEAADARTDQNAGADSVGFLRSRGEAAESAIASSAAAMPNRMKVIDAALLLAATSSCRGRTHADRPRRRRVHRRAAPCRRSGTAESSTLKCSILFAPELAGNQPLPRGFAPSGKWRDQDQCP